jgi:uncharacterized protein (TIGR00299 family) protein
MRIAYLDCASGVSGDMMLGALVDAGVDLAVIQNGIDSLGLPGCRLVGEEVKKKGFRATKVRVEHQPEHIHRHLSHIVQMIDRSVLAARQKELARRIFTRLGQAEAKVHGQPLEKVHFHEVGAADSIADIVGSAIGWDLLAADRIVCSPIPTGQGAVTIAHGRVSIPAPATAELLKGAPLAPSAVRAELTTPTGAAIVTTVANEFGGLPAMSLEAVGYGAGERDLEEQPNLLRILVGQTTREPWSDEAWMLETNMDDCTGELIAHCTARLIESGALDVYTTAIQMKKNRPAVKLSVLCQAPDAAKMESILFRETTTLGVRRWPVQRHKLRRQAHTVHTRWGPIEGKLAIHADGAVRYAPEFESCQRVASQHEAPLRDVYDAALKAFDPAAVQAEAARLRPPEV